MDVRDRRRRRKRGGRDKDRAKEIERKNKDIERVGLCSKKGDRERGSNREPKEDERRRNAVAEKLFSPSDQNLNVHFLFRRGTV